jgi:hypothetical protein
VLKYAEEIVAKLPRSAVSTEHVLPKGWRTVPGSVRNGDAVITVETESVTDDGGLGVVVSVNGGKSGIRVPLAAMRVAIASHDAANGEKPPAYVDRRWTLPDGMHWEFAPGSLWRICNPQRTEWLQAGSSSVGTGFYTDRPDLVTLVRERNTAEHDGPREGETARPAVPTSSMAIYDSREPR